MARRAKKPDAIVVRFLIFVGKPFYLLLSLIVSIIRLPRVKFQTKPRLVFTATLFLALSTFWYVILKDLPSPKELTSREREVSTKIYDRNGVLLYKIFKNKNRSIISLSQVPLTVRLATLAAEDAEFYQHPGFSVRGIFRSLVKNAKTGTLSGGSTITQQLVKNALLSPEKSVRRKIRELILAIEVEFTFSKDQILEMYLNEVSYGGTAYGIEEASRVYFGKDVKDLSLAEAAVLAGLPKSPTKYSPFGTDPEFALNREKDVLRLMEINKFISAEQVKNALSQKLTFASSKTDIKAPHFVMYIRNELVDKYGEEVVEKGGLDVTTTLDYSIQKMAEEAVKKEVESLRGFNVGNGAALVLNPKTGEILAMVGSKDYFDMKADGNVNITTRLRQPGSSIKVVNYAYALENGYTPATILSDTPVTFSVPGLPPYSPKNYDGAFHGSMTVRNALAQSRNIPAVKVLASYGVSRMIEQGRKMGISSWNDPSRYGLSLTLGGGEIKLIDLARVYSVIADYGKKPEIISTLEIKNYKGTVLEHAQIPDSPRGEPVVDPKVAYLLIDILKDNSARAPAFGLNSQLVIPEHPEVAVKTGTSNDLRDNLTLGFNQDFLVATWVGNNNNTPMAKVASGITGATPIWNRIMRNLLADKKAAEWEVPTGLKKVAVCPYTGTLPCDGCPGNPEWFIEDTVPSKRCVGAPTAAPPKPSSGPQIFIVDHCP